MTFIQLPTQHSPRTHTQHHTRKLTDANINRLCNNLSSLSWREVFNSNNVNESYSSFWTEFKTLYDINFPIVKTKLNKNIHKIANYMTQGLLVSRRKKIELLKTSMQHPSRESTHIYKTYRNLYNKVMRASKKAYFDSSLKKAKKDPKKTWKILKEAMNINSNSQKIDKINLNSKILTEPNEIANAFNDFFVTAGQSIADSIPHTARTPESYLAPNNAPDFHLGVVSQGEVVNIIKAFESKSSQDIDGITMKLLKKIATPISFPLAHIFTLSVEQGIFPEALKKSRIVPIHKAGKTDSCNNYRPIALLSTISKILEKIIATRLANHLSIHKLIHENQYGFQRHKNTEHNLMQLINYVTKALNDGEYCVGVFIDLRKAFDVCSHSILLKKLEHLGVRGLALDWFRSYLSNRTQQVDIEGNLSEPKQLNISVLQGSILGPILFLCYINDLPSVSALKTLLFADDTQGLAKGKNLPILMDHVNEELSKWSLWFKANKMAVNTDKTKFIIFHTKGKKITLNARGIYFDNNDLSSPHDPSLVAQIDRIHNNHPSPDHRYYKLLGILIDEHLTLDHHTAHLTAKLSKAIFCLNRAKNFLPTKSLITLYHSLFHSHLLYCPTIVSCTSNKNIDKITKLQKKAIRIATNSPYNAHTQPIFQHYNILPYPKIVAQQQLHFMHAHHYNYLPPSFNNMWQTNATRDTQHNLRNAHEYTTPRINYASLKKFPLFSFPTTWNNAGPSKYHSNSFTFRTALRNELQDHIPPTYPPPAPSYPPPHPPHTP